jgi:thymidine phosphorylase
MLAQEIIRRKRDGHSLTSAQIDAFVHGLTDQTWSEGQVAALAMAIFLKGMSAAETIDLTRAMTRSGTVIDWSSENLHGPVLDKHSTGGVGDKVSLILAPIVAACGCYVPMISGRGLGHTGGTLDKFDSIPGYQTAPDMATLRRALKSAGCAIIGQTGDLAPADKRLYAIRDVTATVESIALITASILSKKLAAGLQGLVMDVKVGNGAFAATHDMASTLARSLVSVANGAGLPTCAWITDMNQVLGHSCGNAVEMAESIDFLKGIYQDPRLLVVTRQLCAEMLLMGRLAKDEHEAQRSVDAALTSGRALEHFARMVSALGGPNDLVEAPTRYLTASPVQRDVVATGAGWISETQTRDIGLLIIELGGGRRVASDPIDHSVGLSNVLPVGSWVNVGDRLATVHAASESDAAMAQRHLQQGIAVSEQQPLLTPAMLERIGPD